MGVELNDNNDKYHFKIMFVFKMIVIIKQISKTID